ncbi:MAG: archaeal heat shock protein Hsp20 [bacterium]|nr:archaeal heat shock protein Hsp20 [bacterium]
MAEKKKEGEEEFGFGLGGLFKGIGDLIGQVSKLAEQAGEIKKTGEIKGLGDKVKGIYGFNIRTLAGGEPKVETFGNIKKTPKGPVVEEVREPIVDVFDEKDHISIIIEMPGVAAEDIKVDVKGDILKLSAATGDRKYSKEVLLPSKVKGEPEIAYKNGILEIKLKKLAG